MTLDEDEIGDWMHGILMERFGLETEAWAIDRVRRVTDRLNAERSPQPPLVAEILWTQEMTAFIVPGRYLYLSRELLQRTASDDPAALVIAHEMAHHDLGHTSLFRGHLAALRKVPFGSVVGAVTHITQQLVVGPEREEEADVHGFDLCISAGYDPQRCLELFDILEAYYLDHGDIDGVFGPDPTHVDTGKLGGLLTNWSQWGKQRIRGYRSLHERRKVLEDRLVQ